MVDKQQYVSAKPGLGEEGARWIADQHVVAIGADTMAVEGMSMEDARAVPPLHQHWLVEKGVDIVEHLRLDEPCHEGIYEFRFIRSRVKSNGATASLVGPAAVI